MKIISFLSWLPTSDEHDLLVMLFLLSSISGGFAAVGPSLFSPAYAGLTLLWGWRAIEELHYLYTAFLSEAEHNHSGDL